MARRFLVTLGATLLAVSASALETSTYECRAGSKFSRHDLAVPGTVLALASGDLDGDGRTDLVASYRRGAGPKAQRFIAVFFRGEAGYPARPDAAFGAPRNAAVFDVGDAIGDAKDEIVYLSSDGVYAQTFTARAPNSPAKLLSAPLLILEPEEDDFVTWDFLRAPAPREPTTLILPTRHALKLFRRDGETWKPWSSVPIDLFSYYDAEVGVFRRSQRGGSTGRPYAFRVTTIVPNLDFVDQTGDGRVDLITHYEDRLAVYAQREDGTLSDRPVDRRWLQLRTPEEIETHDADISMTFLDLDRDGIADASATKISGGVTTLRSETHLYRGLKGGGFEAGPSQVFKDQGFASLVAYVDVDGDGVLEMIHPHSEVSIVGISKMMLSRELSLEIRIRKAAERPLFFERSPEQTLETALGLDLSVGATLRGTFPLFGYDFDGDGIRDVIMSDGGEKMLLHLGKKGERELFEDEGNIALAAEGTNTTQILLPRKDRVSKPEVLLYYVDRGDLAGKLIVFTCGS